MTIVIIGIIIINQVSVLLMRAQGNDIYRIPLIYIV